MNNISTIAVSESDSIQEHLEPFQCQSSSGESGLVYTPNIPDFYFNDENAADFWTGGGANLTDSVNGITHFFTVPASHNCSGDMVSIQYCYQARKSDINKVRTVFNLLAVNRSGLEFTTILSITIQTTPRNSICTNPPGRGMQRICCDTTPLNGFQIPPSEYTFGIVITNVNVRPLAFANSVMEYRVEQFRAALGNAGPSTVTLTAGDLLTDRSLLLIRFFVGKYEWML